MSSDFRTRWVLSSAFCISTSNGLASTTSIFTSVIAGGNRASIEARLSIARDAAVLLEWFGASESIRRCRDGPPPCVLCDVSRP
eukprot:CAMPEP_0117677300 /NCGR_PEP_ID=MMETSP0804-20121206/16672_1 /TAXON_ID=1074897 /ORGANISM="Tetraselmis astigmatica, Strain CCMP880" /LENGTH=83 /DNA_ID=CAMNT_0005486575 /DNA_START=333 /DNA_END=584 /DNA_ORIENTATION=-